MAKPDGPSQAARFDPFFLNARREAVIILIAWAVCLIWAVGFSALAGYDVDSDQVSIILGIPDWVFWGVLVPWIAATVFSVWFSLVYIADDDPGVSDGEEAPHD